MNYIHNYIVTKLEHSPKLLKNQFIPNNFIFNTLWYSVNKESYPQREIAFDNSCLDKQSPLYSSSIDYFFAIYLFRKLNLDKMYWYDENSASLNSDVDNLSSNDVHTNLLFINVGKASFFNTFYDSSRNSIAHGTFNYTDRFFMVGQFKANALSQLNYYYQSKTPSISNLFSELETSNVQIRDFNNLATFALSVQPGVTINGSDIIFNSTKVIIDTTFKFKKIEKDSNQSKQLTEYILSKKISNIILIVCDISISNFNDPFFISNNVTVVTSNKLPTFFSCNIVKTY